MAPTAQRTHPAFQPPSTSEIDPEGRRIAWFERALQRSFRVQLDRAAEVQQSMLPDVSGTVAGYRLACAYRPCEALGGDFFDVYSDRGGVTLMVADAMGHGVEAALITMLLKAVFHEVAPQESAPHQLLALMNERLVNLIPQGSFAATAVVRLQHGESEIQIANAGLPYPFVLRAGDRCVEELRVNGIPLGLDVCERKPTYKNRRVCLAPRDVLLVASDGIGSIEGDDGLVFEDGSMWESLNRMVGRSGETVIDGLLAEATTFSKGRPFPDDVNLIGVWRDGKNGAASC